MSSEQQTERRTLSCQTGIELLQYLLHSHTIRMHMKDQQMNEAAGTVSQWAELSPQALLESMNTARLRRSIVPTAHILEESASEQSGDEDSGQLKHITINLGDCEYMSDSSSHSPISWSHNSNSVVWWCKVTNVAYKIMLYNTSSLWSTMFLWLCFIF